jgi:phosphatidylserine/phosphatidylglycerophosphate/cardiolipin synthase-like enzyme
MIKPTMVVLATILGFAALGGSLRVGSGAPCPAGSAEIHYSPDENLEPVDVALIGSAQASIDVAAYVLTDFAVASALREAGARGARVRIWRDAEMAEKTASVFDFEAELDGAQGLQARIKPAGALMHLKGYCVDGRVLRTGSANFSRSGLTRQDNDLVIVRGAGACDGFEAKFEKAWGGR